MPDSTLWLALATMMTGAVVALVALLLAYGFAP